MIKTGNKIRLTNTELNVLRQRAAQNGIAVNSILTESELLEAIISGIDDAVAEDMVQFFISRGAVAQPPDEK